MTNITDFESHESHKAGDKVYFVFPDLHHNDTVIHTGVCVDESENGMAGIGGFYVRDIKTGALFFVCDLYMFSKKKDAAALLKARQQYLAERIMG